MQKGTIYLDAKTMEILKKWKVQQRQQLHMLGINTLKINQLVFANHKNELENLMTPNHWLDRIINKYHLKRISPHVLRHTVATLLSQSNVPAKQIQTMLGDSTLEIVMNTYTHVDDQQKKETTNHFSNFLNG